jgi:hypothetical protein
MLGSTVVIFWIVDMVKIHWFGSAPHDLVSPGIDIKIYLVLHTR